MVVRFGVGLPVLCGDGHRMRPGTTGSLSEKWAHCNGVRSITSNAKAGCNTGAWEGAFRPESITNLQELFLQRSFGC